MGLAATANDRLIAPTPQGGEGATIELGVPSVGGFPLATLLINVTGAFALGLGVLLWERLAPTRYLRPLLGIGFLGAYTTFSTMAMEGVRLLDQGRPGLAVGYWLATLLGGQMAGVWGMWLGRLRRPRRRHGVER
jgi:CrcB protein